MKPRGRQTPEFLAHKGIITPEMRANSHAARRHNAIAQATDRRYLLKLLNRNWRIMSYYLSQKTD